ncbi:MAG TPA: class I SAM-dependent methyltransferase, partial [Chiayiivirga sp.]|nr:class I SAM-dependent methyltransferase [Chiayiivirga sp.]
RQVVHGGLCFWTRPGLFAWDRVDAASALLAEHLPVGLAGRVADAGAGWGYLSTALLRRCPGIAALDLFEADARALEPARRNLEDALAGRTDVAIRAHWHDVTAGLPGPFDAVVMNPPFHVGRADDPALGRAFIASAAAALAPGGALWLVANRHLPYEAELEARFGTVRRIAERDGFKVIHAKEPRR